MLATGPSDLDTGCQPLLDQGLGDGRRLGLAGGRGDNLDVVRHWNIAKIARRAERLMAGGWANLGSDRAGGEVRGVERQACGGTAWPGTRPGSPRVDAMNGHLRRRVSQRARPGLIGPAATLVALEEGQVGHGVGGNELVFAGGEPRVWPWMRRHVPALKYVWSST